MRRRAGKSAMRGRGQRGVAALEFALVVIPLITLLLGTMQFAWYFFAAQSATSAAREGARRIVVGDCWGGSFSPYVSAQGPTISSAAYAPADLSTVSPGDVVTVTVIADGGLFNLFPLPNGGQVKREFEARLEDTAPGDGTCS